MRAELRNALTALLLAVAGPALAVAPDWTALSAEQQALIAPAIKGQAAEFDRLPDTRRQRLADGASRWLQMSPEQKVEASRQLGEWQRMSSSERQAALQRREQFRQLPADQRASLLQRHRQFEALPEAEQQRLRDAFRQTLEQNRQPPPLSLPSTDSLMPPMLPLLPALPPPTTTPNPVPGTGGVLPR